MFGVTFDGEVFVWDITDPYNIVEIASGLTNHRYIWHGSFSNDKKWVAFVSEINQSGGFQNWLVECEAIVVVDKKEEEQKIEIKDEGHINVIHNVEGGYRLCEYN